jgi:hypothetical protein
VLQNFISHLQGEVEDSLGVIMAEIQDEGVDGLVYLRPSSAALRGVRAGTPGGGRAASHPLSDSEDDFSKPKGGENS